MSSKINHYIRSKRADHRNKHNFKTMVRRKQARDFYFSLGETAVKYAQSDTQPNEAVSAE